MSTHDSFIRRWSTTPASNGLSPNVSPFGWQEGMAPSAVNDTARQNMTDHRYQWEDAEWFDWGDAVSKASATTFKIATDVTSRYQVNRRLKIFDSTVKYATIISSSYSAPDTTIGLQFDTDTSLGASFTAVGLAILSATNPSLPRNIAPNKNIVIGGNFDTNPWQRGTSFTAPSNGAYTADRFIHSFVGTMVFDILKTADAPTVAQCGMFVQNCLHLDVTTADGTIAAGDQTIIRTYIEGYDFAYIAQQTFTLSFWVKSTKTGIHCVSFENSGNNRTYVAEYTINASDTWEFKSITVTASPTAGTWDYTNGVGLRVTWALAAGSNFHTTAGAWQTGSFLSTSNQVNSMDSTSNNFKLALIKLERGSVATPFEIEDRATVLAKCQRYYHKSFNQGVTPANANSQNGGRIGMVIQVANANNTNSVGTWVPWPVKMRSAPTITFYNPRSGGTASQWDNGSASLANAATDNLGNSGGLLYDSGATASVARYYIQMTANSEL